MIKFLCPCGAKLSTRPAPAGKRVRCPKCGRTTPILSQNTPDHHAAQTQSAAAEPIARPPAPPPRPAARGGRPGDMIDLTAPRPSEAVAPPTLDDDLGLVPAAPAVATRAGPAAPRRDGDLMRFEGESGEVVAPCPAPVAPSSAPSGVDYAHDPLRARPRSRRDDDVVREPTVGFWRDAIRSFWYPFMSGGNIAAFLVIAFFVAVREFLGFALIFGTIGRGIIFGWLASVYMNIVVQSCTGDDDLPTLKMEEGLWGDIVAPALRYIATFLLAMLPAIAFAAFILLDLLPAEPWAAGLWLVWAGLGIFAWPMIILLFSLNEGQLIFRLDLMIVTILRSILPYLAIWLLLLIVGVLELGASLGFIWAALRVENPIAGFFAGMTAGTASEVVSAYLTIVSMRIVGLYYRHFKRRFAFRLE